MNTDEAADNSTFGHFLRYKNTYIVAFTSLLSVFTFSFFILNNGSSSRASESDTIISVEAENMTLSGPVLIAQNSSASGSKYVEFGEAAAPTPIPTNTPTIAVTAPPTAPTATPTRGTTPPPTSSNGIWISPEEISKLPTTGAEWTALYNAASGNWGTADVSNQDSNHSVRTLAGALVCVRTGEFCDKTRQGLVSAINTEEGARWLAVGRNLTSYIIAADLMEMRADSNPNSDNTKVYNWLARFLTRTLKHNINDTQIQIEAFASGSNASAQEGAVYIALAAYTKNQNKLEHGWNRFRLYACDLTSPEKVINIEKGITYGWNHGTPACAVNPKGATKNGRRIDGAIINDMYRGGYFTASPWPGYTQYPWVGLEGFMASAVILSRSGYPAFEVSDKAVARTFEFLWYVRDTTGDAIWFDGVRSNENIFLANKIYGTNYPIVGTTGLGRITGFTGWSHANWSP